MSAALDRLRRYRTSLAYYDWLMPGDDPLAWPQLPPKRRWFRKDKPVYPTQEQTIWAGSIARARVLMDLDGLIEDMEKAGE